MEELSFKKDSAEKGEIVVYQPDNITRLEVRVKNDSVWLTQSDLAQLFGVNQPAISKHIRNIYSSGELSSTDTYSILEYMGNDGRQKYAIKYYNLDVILSVGYRVNSRKAISFRKWASSILKEYLLRGYSINNRIDMIEDKLDRKLVEHERRLNAHEAKIDFFVRTSLPPVEGIFFDGQIFDAYVFAADLVRSAESSIILIDNYIDETVLTILDKRHENVEAIIYTKELNRQFSLDLKKHNEQYRPIEVRTFNKAHDRFLLIDDKVYHLGASLKDLGRKWFAFSLMKEWTGREILERMEI